jgi:hypothetical protein
VIEKISTEFQRDRCIIFIEPGAGEAHLPHLRDCKFDQFSLTLKPFPCGITLKALPVGFDISEE